MRYLFAILLAALCGCANRSYTNTAPKTEVIVELDGKAGVMRWREPGKRLYTVVPLALGTNRIDIGEVVIRVHSNTLLSWNKLAKFDADRAGVKIGSSDSGTEIEKLGPLLKAAFEAGMAAGKMAAGIP